MSDIFGALVNSFGPLIGDSLSDYALLQPNLRQIGTVFPNVVVEEVHHDEMAITLHPVETGAPVTDHAFMQPFTVEIRAGWSNSTAQTMGYCEQIYEALQQQQQSAQPFSIVTGKRSYDNMLMRSLMVKTDVTSEWALMVIAICQQIIITSTQTTPNDQAAANTDGTSAVATTSADGNFNVSGNAPQTAPGTIAPDAQGNYGFNNSPYNAGSQILTAAPAGAPTVESLTANQGV